MKTPIILITGHNTLKLSARLVVICPACENGEHGTAYTDIVHRNVNARQWWNSLLAEQGPTTDLWIYGRCLRVFWRSGWRGWKLPYGFHRWSLYGFGIGPLGFMYWPKREEERDAASVSISASRVQLAHHRLHRHSGGDSSGTHSDIVAGVQMKTDKRRFLVASGWVMEALIIAWFVYGHQHPASSWHNIVGITWLLVGIWWLLAVLKLESK